MKRTRFFVIALTVFLGTALSAQETPVCTIPGATVLDAGSLRGKYKDDVKLLNLSDKTDLLFSVYFYEPQKKDWIFYGRGKVSHYYDSESLDSLYEDRIRTFRYFAIVPENGTDFLYTLDARHNDLYIHIAAAAPVDDEERKQNAVVFDTYEVKGRFYDDIEFINCTQDENILFWVYAFNAKSEPWQKIGAAKVDKLNDSESVDTPVKNLSSYRYFAVAADNGKQYSYQIKKHDGDLCFYVR